MLRLSALRPLSLFSRSISGMSYQDAISSLNTLQSNAATLAAVASRVLQNEEALAEMNEFVTRIGLTPDDINALNVIHVTGTKGKGSTSAFTDLILRHARPDIKVGLYTSPHLVAVRERIRINGRPLSEEEFAKYFFQVWKKLQDNPPIIPGTRLMPNYFRYLTLVAFYAFKDLKVDATILEVGIGGGGDSTNVVSKPVVTGITALGMDHVAVLGGTIEAIARQKAGIYKKDVPAFTVEQHDPSTDLEAILRETAMNVKASEFRVVKEFSALKDIKLGLAGRHQWSNASLAVELARAFLTKKHPSLYPDPIPGDFVAGLENTKWPGRCQTILDPHNSETTWFLDGAHTEESLKCCIQWFASPNVGLFDQPTGDAHRPLRVLIFNCTSGRSAEVFLRTIFNELETQLSIFKSPEETIRFFDQVIFCSNVTYSDGHFKGDLTSVALASAKHTGPTTQDQLKVAWSRMVKEFPSNAIHSFPSIEHAVRKVREHSATRRTHVLVAGSLHLVGGVIEVAGLSSVALGDL
ncbi:Mur ligase [Boletus edulis BED1]|uniref:Folylpolyglutamate synthase n=1 Tax=Boletus edulis BED1 TaxID=1328754 RepID=A0AAD4C763_BOLED|nr:Mur ligase [Boletus edulis BED1]